jgi:hypothetical protein
MFLFHVLLPIEKVIERVTERVIERVTERVIERVTNRYLFTFYENTCTSTPTGSPTAHRESDSPGTSNRAFSEQAPAAAEASVFSAAAGDLEPEGSTPAEASQEEPVAPAALAKAAAER